MEHADPPLMKPGELVLSRAFPDKREKMMSSEFRVATMMGFVPSQFIIEAALADEAHRIRMMYLQGANPLLSYSDAKRTHEALRRLDFLAVAEIFLTPTAQLADLVLPAAGHFEFDDIGHYGLRHGFVLARPRIVDLPGVRRLSPNPRVIVHPDTAQRFRLHEGQWAFIGTGRGTIRQKVTLSADLDPRVVVASAGWWFPERKDLELSGWKESNLNILTSNDPPYDPAIGTPILRGFPCRIWSDQKSDPMEDKGDPGERESDR